jgi:tetratricopeptide (TPR) repeat protein
MMALNRDGTTVGMNLKKALADARRAAAHGQLDRAAGGYKAVLQHSPDDVQLLRELAEIQAAGGNRHEAVDTLLTAAEILFLKGQLKSAVGLYRRVLQLNALLVTAYVRLFEIFKALGMLREARIFMYGAISIFQKAGFPADLRNMLERIIEIDPEDAQIRLALAETHLRLKRTDVAILHFETSLPLLKKKGLDDLFIRAAEHIIYYRPDNVSLCRQLAALYLERKEGSRAEKLLMFCYQQDPKDTETLDLLVRLFLDRDDNKKALSLLLEKASALEDSGDRKTALETCYQVLKLDPRNAAAAQFINKEKRIKARPSLGPRRADRTSLVPMPSAIVKPDAPSILEKPKAAAAAPPQAAPDDMAAEIAHEISSPIAFLDSAVEETDLPAAPMVKKASGPPSHRETRPYGKAGLRPKAPRKDVRPAPGRDHAMSYVPPLAHDSGLDWGKAVDILRTHVGDDTEAHYDLGLAYMEMEQWNEAIAEFELAAQEPGRKASCGYLMGKCHEKMNDILQAIARYKEGLSTSEIDEEHEKTLWYELGSAHLQLEELRTALDWFKKVHARDPGFRHTRQHVAEIKKRIVRLEEKKKKSTLILPGLGTAGLPPQPEHPVPLQGKTVSAAPPASAAPASGGPDEISSFDEARRLMKNGSWKDALAGFEKLASDPTLRPECYRMIGRCHVMTGDLQLAIIKYKVGLMARNITLEQELDLYNDISFAYLQSGNHTQSLQYLKQIMAKNPAYPEIQKKIARVESLMRKPVVK